MSEDVQETTTEVPVNVAELSKSGYAFIKADQLSEAEECFHQILEIDSSNSYALVGLGDTARKRGNFTMAIEHYNICLEYHFDNNYALFGLADSYKALKEYQKAIDIWEKYLQKDERNITVLTRIADAYKKVRNFPKSKEIYLKALEMESDNPYALIGLGYLHFDFKYFAEALIYWEKVLTLKGNENNIKILTALGNCHRKLKTFEKGLDFFITALGIEDDNFYALFGMADCYRGLKRHEESLSFWTRILFFDPNNKVILTRAGDACRVLGRLDEAEDYYHKALNVGFDAYAVLGLALINKERGKNEEAVESLEKLRKNDLKNARLYHVMAECYVELGEKEKAIDVLADFLKTGQRNSYISNFLDTLKK